MNVFENLFVLDLANNHFGDLNHAKKIISNFKKICQNNKIKFAIKFQFRNLDTYIHTKYKNDLNNKFVKRFNTTRLKNDEITNLVKFCKKIKVKTACTPFDESSVDRIEDLNIDIIKIASVSSNDFSILNRVSQNNKPKIISTGGLNLKQIDKVVSFMQHKGQKFALMHCVSIYPTENKDMHLAFIKNLINRYKNITIGWSTHENPNDFLPSTIAYSCGARMFEKHIGINTKKYKLNKYSIQPDQFQQYLINLKNVQNIYGKYEKVLSNEEHKTLGTLQRGLYVRDNCKKGDILSLKNIYLSFPKLNTQLGADNFKEGLKLSKDLQKDKPIKYNDISKRKSNQNLEKEILKESIHKVKAMLNYSKIELGSNFDLELSHHYGIKNFKKTGCFLFNIINKDYCKKILVMLPNQKHPLHFHKRKEETFHILSGQLVSILDKKKHTMYPGDLIDVKPGIWHEFYAKNEGCIFEEISTTSYSDDSFYQDPVIKKMTRNQRKTFVKSWGRFEI